MSLLTDVSDDSVVARATVFLPSPETDRMDRTDGLLTTSMTSEPAIELIDIYKTFGSTRALEAVSLPLFPREVHAPMGENGAGRSTLFDPSGPSVRRIPMCGIRHTRWPS